MVHIPTAADGNKNNNRRTTAICATLSNERRVAVIDALDSGGEMSMTQVIDYVVSCDKQSGQDETDVRKRVTIALFQTHLPRLEAAGVIGYDWDIGEIKRGSQYRVVRDSLAAVRQNSR